jgi:hypothetical protein
MSDDRVVDLEQGAIACRRPFDLKVERGDLFVGAHVGDRQRDLVCHLLQERGIHIGILVRLPTTDNEDADPLPADNQGNETGRVDAFCNEPTIVGVQLLSLEIVSHDRALLFEHQAADAILPADLQPGSEVIGGRAFNREEAESVPRGIVDR